MSCFSREELDVLFGGLEAKVFMEPKEKCNDLVLQPPKKTQLDYKAIKY